MAPATCVHTCLQPTTLPHLPACRALVSLGRLEDVSPAEPGREDAAGHPYLKATASRRGSPFTRHGAFSSKIDHILIRKGGDSDLVASHGELACVPRPARALSTTSQQTACGCKCPGVQVDLLHHWRPSCAYLHCCS